MRISLQEMTGNESGWMAWCLAVHGFATWASTEAAVIEQVPRKLATHQSWLARHEVPAVNVSGAVEIVERVRGNEILFSRDYDPCGHEEIDLTLRLLSATRADLISLVLSLPEAAFDWDPPYREFASWATWRSIRAILAHVANCETHYYLPAIGHTTELPPASSSRDWQRFLQAHREETVAFLTALKQSPDRARVTTENEERWSVRKVLRRLVWHELLHWKSIMRIGREFTATSGLL